VTQLTGYFVPERGSSYTDPPNCYIILRDMSRVKARVNFDIPSEYEHTLKSTTSDKEIVCNVLMIAARLGIAIKVDDEDPTRYKRVGHLCIYDAYSYDRAYAGGIAKKLSVTDFPDAQSIVLV
jgi:hypothetical protein